MNPIEVIIKGSGLTYQGQTTLTKAAQVIAFLNTESELVTTETVLVTNDMSNFALESSKPKISPRQALIDSGARSNSEKIAAFAHYLKLTQNQVATVSDLKLLFSKSGEPVPKNFARDLKDAVRSNYVYESEKNEYELTEYGHEAVENKFALEKVKKTERKRVMKTKNVEVRNEVVMLDISTVEPGYPQFHSLNKGQQILWICAVADFKGIEELNYKEIVALIDRLKGNVTTGTFTALNEGNIKNGYLKVSPGGFKVTQVGIDKLKELA